MTILGDKERDMHAVLTFLLAAAIALILPFHPGTCQGEGIPDQIKIGSLEKYYEPAQFNHKAHIDTLKDCAVCHHHSTGTLTTDPNCARCHSNSTASKTVACKGCHLKDRFSASVVRERTADKTTFHIDKPGLKGAYHQKCLGCHAKMNAPTGCQDCHERKDDGDALFRSGKYAPVKKASNGHGH